MWVSIVKDYVVPILSATATAGGIFMALMRKTFVPARPLKNSPTALRRWKPACRHCRQKLRSTV